MWAWGLSEMIIKLKILPHARKQVFLPLAFIFRGLGGETMPLARKQVIAFDLIYRLSGVIFCSSAIPL